MCTSLLALALITQLSAQPQPLPGSSFTSAGAQSSLASHYVAVCLALCRFSQRIHAAYLLMQRRCGGETRRRGLRVHAASAAQLRLCGIEKEGSLLLSATSAAYPHRWVLGGFCLRLRRCNGYAAVLRRVALVVPLVPTFLCHSFSFSHFTVALIPIIRHYCIAASDLRYPPLPSPSIHLPSPFVYPFRSGNLLPVYRLPIAFAFIAPFID